MAIKGSVEKNRTYELSTRREILQLMKNGEWYRNQDILRNVKGSSATVQKYLNELAKGMVEKKTDMESKDYPHPVYYRIRPWYVKNPLRQPEKDWQNGVLNEPLELIEFKNDKDISHYVEFLNVQTGLQLLGQVSRFLDEKNEFAFSQAIDLWVLATYRENAFKLRDKLEQLAAKDVNVQALIYDATQKMLKHFEHLRKEK